MLKLLSVKSIVGAAIIVVLLACSCSVIFGACNEVEVSQHQTVEVPQIFNYAAYVEKFKKSYNKTETINKAKLFFGRTIQIFQHNVLYLQSKVGYFLRQNEFTDITSNELKLKYSNSEYSHMKPVVEALKNPDAPANLYDDHSVANPLEPNSSKSAQSRSDQLTETMLGQKSTDKKDDNNPTNVIKKHVNFLDDQNVDDISKVLNVIKTYPNVAEQMAVVVDLKDDEKNKPDIDNEMKNNQIEYRSMVDSNNKHYDPQMITSYGLFSTEPMWEPENYAKYLMDEGYHIEPYPVAEAPEILYESRSPLSSLLHSVKNIFEYMVLDDWEKEDDYDGEEVEENKKEEKEEAKESLIEGPTEIEKERKGSIVEYDIDWRESGCVSKPRSQMSCNSCYAFATLSLMEYFYCKQSKKLTYFSTQYVVDCGANLSVGGCRGGKLSSVGNFINKYGIELDSLYPYNGRENQCPYSDEDERQKKPGYLRPIITHWQMFPEMSAWSKWVKKSPIIVGINMPTDFLAYGGGIHDGSDCTEDMVHALMLVGSGTQDGKKFWLLKNSYAESWGEEGYFRLSKSAPLRCFNAATVVRTDFSKVME